MHFDGPCISVDVLTALYDDACSAVAEARDRNEISEHLEAGTITESRALALYAAQARDTDLKINAATIRLNPMSYRTPLNRRAIRARTDDWPYRSTRRRSGNQLARALQEAGMA